jgi:glycosyltransferase involved in cell wall biosynthesis
LKLEWMQAAGPDIARTAEVVADVAASISADVIHANQFAAACAAVETPIVLTLHSDVLSWSRWTLRRPADPREWAGYVRLVQDGVQHARAVVSVSHFLAHEVADLYGITRPIDVIHNGWPVTGAGPVAEDEPVTMVAGRVWDPAKNIGLVARATRGWDPGEVVVAGETRHPDSGDTAAVAPPLRPLGLLLPDELATWLQGAAIYLSPALYDPFGLLPLQAALSGCALLLSDIPSYRELWDGAACFFRANDPTDLRRQWRRLVLDPALRLELRRQAGQRARSRYTAEHMTDGYLELYSRLEQRVAA